MNWYDPTDRAELLERVGIDEYNRQMERHLQTSTVATVNGYPIRPVTSRFGRIFMVDGANTGFLTLDQAKDHAAKLPPRVDNLLDK